MHDAPTRLQSVAMPAVMAMAAAETASRAAADAAVHVAAAEKAVAIAKTRALAAADTAWGRALRDTDSTCAAAHRIRSEAPHSADKVAKTAINVLGLPLSKPFTSEDLRTCYRERVEQMDELIEQTSKHNTPGTSVAELTRAYCLLEPHCTDADWSLGRVRPSTAPPPTTPTALCRVSHPALPWRGAPLLC